MSNVNLKNFVNINIQKHISGAIEGSRDTLALFTNDARTTASEITGTIVFNSNTYNTDIVDISNYEKVFEGKTVTLAYLAKYFSNGGIKAYVIEGVSLAAMTVKAGDPLVITSEILSTIDNKYIYVAYAGADADVETVYAGMKEIAQFRNGQSSIYGINEKIIITRSYVKTDEDNVANFAVKYSNDLAADMTMAAYLSQIDLEGIDTVKDYAFTVENTTEQNINNSDFETLMDNNYNVDIYLSNAIRNCGGNNKDGNDFVNNFCRIVLHQTLTDQLIDLLTQKIKNYTGVSKIYSVISKELEKYLTCGYLTTDKVWSDNDYKVTINGTSYTIINKGDALLNGYLIKVLPLSSLTDAEKLAHKAPPIFVIIADQYSIRVITVTGEVI